MIDKEIYLFMDNCAYYNNILLSVLYMITMMRITSPKFNDKISKYDGNISELTGLPVTICHTVAFFYSLYKIDILSVILFSYWGPGFLLTAYQYLRIKKYKLKFNWSPLGLISSYLCKMQYLIYLMIYFYYECYNMIYFFSLWIMHDQIHLIWFHKNTDRARRVTEDYWIVRLMYPGFLIFSILFNWNLYYLILGLCINITWIYSLKKSIIEGFFFRLPDNLEYLRNIVYLSPIYFKNRYSFEIIDNNNLDKYNNELKLFEKETKQKYPLGNEFFTIDHGVDYFAFFKRLGEVNYFIIRSENKIIGTGCAILKDDKYFYLCDLKIRKEYQGNNLSFKLFFSMYFKFKHISNSGYLITMNKKNNPVINIFMKFSFLFNIKKDQILIYKLNTKEFDSVKNILKDHFGTISFLKLNGIKNIIIESEHKSQIMNLYHLQHHNSGKYSLENIESDGVIMFSCWEKSSLVKLLNEKNITTDTTATILSSNMEDYNWDMLSTSEI